MLPLQPNAVDFQSMMSTVEIPPTTDKTYFSDRIQSSSQDVEILFEIGYSWNMVKQEVKKEVKQEPDDGSYNKYEQGGSCQPNVSEIPTEQSLKNSTREITPRMTYPFASSIYQTSRSHSVPITENIYIPHTASHNTVDYSKRPHSAAPCSESTIEPHALISSKENFKSPSLINMGMKSPIINNSREELLPHNINNFNFPSPIQNTNVFSDKYAAKASPPLISEVSNQNCQRNEGDVVVTDPSGRSKVLKLVSNVTSFKRAIPQATVQSNHAISTKVVPTIDNQRIQQQNARIEPKRNISKGNTNGRSSNEQLLSQNTNSNVVKRKRGRPPGQKNKKPSIKMRQNLPLPHAYTENLHLMNQLWEVSGHSSLEEFRSYVVRHTQIYSDMDNVQQFQSLKATKKKKRIPKSNYKDAKDSQRKQKNSTNLTLNENLQQTSEVRNNQRDNNDCLIVEHYASTMSISENSSASQVFNIAQEKQRHQERERVGEKDTSDDCLTMLKDNSNETMNSNVKKVAETSTLHNNSYIQNDSISSVETPPSVPQEKTFDCKINDSKTSNVFSSQSSLQSNRPETEDSYTLASSDDEGYAFVYKMRDHAAKNVMYSPNVLKECIIGNNCDLVSNEKSSQVPCENYNTENASCSLNSNSLSCTYSGTDASASPNFRNNIDPPVCEADSTQFSEQNTEFQENVDSTTISPNCIDLGNGKIYLNSYCGGDFTYFMYTPDNEKYYTFDPKYPTIVNFPQVKRSNYLPASSEIINGQSPSNIEEGITTNNNSSFENNLIRYQNLNDSRAYPSITSNKDSDFYSTVRCQSSIFAIDERNTKSIENKIFKLFRLEIRGNDRLGFQEIMETSNSESFECNNFTISYEPIPDKNADQILKLCKPSHNDTIGLPQTSQNNVAIFENHESIENHTVCFWHASLLSCDPDSNSQNNDSPSLRMPSLFETPLSAPEKVQVPCRRLLGISDLPFRSLISFVKENKKLATLIEKEISEYMSGNATNTSSELSKVKPMERNKHQSNFPTQENNNSTVDRPKIKEEPPDAKQLFHSPSLQEMRCTESVVPMDFSYENPNNQNPNTFDGNISDDCILIDDDITNVTQNSHYIPRNNVSSTYSVTEVNQSNWSGNTSQHSNDMEIGNQFAYKTCQPTFYESRREAPPCNLYRSDSNNQCISFEDAGRFLLEDSPNRVMTYVTRSVLNSENFEHEVNSQTRDYFVNGSSLNSHKNYTLHENMNTETNNHFSYQKEANQSMRNEFEYHYQSGNIYQAPSLSATNNQVKTSRYKSNPYNEFGRTNNVPDPMLNVQNSSVASLQRVNNLRETASLVTGSQNFARTLETYVDNFEKLQDSPGGRVSKSSVAYNELSTMRHRVNKHQEINPAYRFNSGGNIINETIPSDKSYSLCIKDPNLHSYTAQYERRFHQESNYNSMTPPMNLSATQFLPPTSQAHLKSSNIFLGESLDPKNSDRVNNQYPNDLTRNVPQKSANESYRMCANDELPLNLHVASPYYPGYNGFQTTPQSVMAEPSQIRESLREDQIFQQCHFLELTRPGYQNGPGKQTDSHTFMGSSHSSAQSLEPSEFTEQQMYPEVPISGMDSCYINDFQCEELPPPESMQHDKPEGPTKDHNSTISVQIEQAVLSKNENQLTRLLSEVEKYADRTQYHRIEAHLGLLQGRFEDTFRIIQENNFPVEIHREMQHLWSQVQKLVENQNLPKNSRLKQRASERSFPSTIFVDSNEVLSDWYKRDMYPKADTRVILATKTGLSEKQVNTWFKNRRQRDRRTNGSVRGGRRGGRRPRHPKLSPNNPEPVIPRTSGPSMPIFPTTFPTDK